jgi:hypothetical protein
MMAVEQSHEFILFHTAAHKHLCHLTKALVLSDFMLWFMHWFVVLD